jgi:uncharacterized protein (TIGR03000 family)
MKRFPHLPPVGLAVLLLFCLSGFLWGQVEEKPVLLEIRAAPDAKLEIEGDKTRQTGEVRRFQSPPIAVDRDYSYTLLATWKQAGKELRAGRKITVQGGQTVAVDLRTPDQPPLAEAFLLKGQFAEGETALMNRLKSSAQDDQARFGLGTLQFARAVERLGQSLYRYGLRSDRGQRLNVPFLRLPVPLNPKPERLTYPAFRKILEDLITDLQKVEATLSPIQDETVKLPLRVGQIRLDLTGAGKADDLFITLLNRYMGGQRNIRQDEDLLIVFDRGDVAWLRGYCHLLMALAQVGLAYDWQELFDCSAHVFFAKVETPHEFLTTLKDAPGQGFFDLGGTDLVDVIAFIHLIRLPIKEPARMKSALSHLEQMVALSKESWKFILAETDDDHEWLPNPKQKGVLGIPVRQEMIDSWLEFVEEMEAILAGKRLIPFWRGDEKRGVNLKRVFTEPRPLDLVLWIQGTAATPYLEEGPITKQAVWDRLQRVFRGEFIGFAIWFN